jgi:nucleoside-diphosphate-sugar epimerase
MERNKIAITGSTGFLGANLIKRLKDESCDLRIFDRQKYDFFKISTLSDFLEGCKTVYHLAGQTDNSKDAYDFNVTSTSNLLSVASKVSPGCRIVFSSSFAVYKTPKASEKINENFQLQPRNNYGLSKLKCEALLANNYRKFKNDTYILRFSNIYGSVVDGAKKSVIKTFIDNIKDGKAINIYGDKEQKFDFIYINDVVEALLLAGHTKTSGLTTINICLGKAISIINLVNLIEKQLNKKAVINYLPNIHGKNAYWNASNELARHVLKWRPKTNIETGLALSINKDKIYRNNCCV